LAPLMRKLELLLKRPDAPPPFDPTSDAGEGEVNMAGLTISML
jgi:hypothetical protein